MGKQRKKQRENEIFVSVVYIEGTFSTGWSHQPVLKACFGQAKRREATPFSTGWWHKPILKAPPFSTGLCHDPVLKGVRWRRCGAASLVPPR